MKLVAKIFKIFGYVKQTKSKSYKDIIYLNDIESFEDRLLTLTVQGNELGRARSKEDYQVFGMFFTILLLIEYKLAHLLKCIDDNIEPKMLGQKIDVFKHFLKVYEWQEDEDIEEYRKLLQPLVEINKLRGELAHDLTKVSILSSELKMTKAYIQKRRPDLYDKVKECPDEQALCIGLLSIYGFVFSYEIAKLGVYIDYSAFSQA
ncbi:hypothetical protein [Acinetobacter oleivorans]|uniref:hypothetical protein n=1 Tax=Acinetobacter oleivorans TaxID=1148157 RepID=UPI001C070C8D|nr:hypothetical protein [Acinetobacter oleivorans]